MLTDQQKQEFFERGVLNLPGIVPVERANQALRAINADLGKNGMHPDELTKFRAQSYCPALQSDSVITDLYNASPLKDAAESLIGPGRVKPVRAAQIALRFPSMDAPRDFGPHLDGMYSPTNGVKEGTIGNFTALVGVFLSDLPERYRGNFTYWPGTHTKYEAYFREHGPESLLKGLPPIELPEPEQFLGHVGDAALVHYQIAHAIVSNASPHIRYALFFRLSHVEHDQNHWECMTDIWKEWEGLRDVNK